MTWMIAMDDSKGDDEDDSNTATLTAAALVANKNCDGKRGDDDCAWW